jgi:ribosomal protein L4
VADLLDRLPVAGRTLLVLPAADALVARSAANVRGIAVRAAASVSLRDILDADYLVLTRPAVDVVAEVFGR